MSAALDAPTGLSALDRPNSYIGRSVPRPNLARLPDIHGGDPLPQDAILKPLVR